jgi:hypothetical protein
MTNLIPLKIGDEYVFVEVEMNERDVIEKGLAEKVQIAFAQVQSTIVNVARGLCESVKQLDQEITPDEFSFQFSVGFSAEYYGRLIPSLAVMFFAKSPALYLTSSFIL